jgi:hypothetical protein
MLFDLDEVVPVTFSPTCPHSPLRLDLYVAQVQASMMAHYPSFPNTALEQKMSRQGNLSRRRVNSDSR